MADDICSICCETFNKQARKKTTCTYCSHSACLTCQKTFLLNNFGDAYCMSCRRGFNRDALVGMFPTTFLNKDYKRHRENILFEREKCLLPATQVEIERDDILVQMKLRLKEVQEQQKVHYKVVQDLACRRTLANIKRIRGLPYEVVEETEEVKDARKEISKIGLVIRDMRTEIWRFAHGVNTVRNGPERVAIVRKCPHGECRGFLGNDWKCGLCNAHVCKKCHEVMGVAEEKWEGEHECKPENVETAKLLATDTKNCPSCGTMIYKISGCQQMWCTQCHTAFDWKTLRIETGLIHNPHYYEFQRAANGGVAPRVAGDVPGGICGDVLPRIGICMEEWRRLRCSVALQTELADIHRLIMHIRHVDLLLLPGMAHNVQSNIDLRKQYLKGLIDEKKFRCLIQRREKKGQKGRELRQILEMFSTCATDILGKTLQINGATSVNVIKKKVTEYKKLCDYFNESMAKVSNVYGGVRYIIDESGMRKGICYQIIY